MDWKSETTLGQLPPDQDVVIERPGRFPIRTTVGALLQEARLPADFTLTQVEFAFSTGCQTSRSETTV